MPRTPSPPAPTATVFAKHMLEARESCDMRLDEASVWARRALGSKTGPSRETIRRYETGVIREDEADPAIIAALAKVYNVPVKQLSPSIAAKLELHRKMFVEVLAARRTRDQRTARSRWTMAVA